MENYLLKLKKKKEILEFLIQKRDILLKSNESESSKVLFLISQRDQIKKEIELLEIKKSMKNYTINTQSNLSIKENKKKLDEIERFLELIKKVLKKCVNNLEELNLEIQKLYADIDLMEFIIMTTKSEIMQNKTLDAAVTNEIMECYMDHPNLALTISILEFKDLVMSNLMKHPDILKMEQFILEQIFHTMEDHEEDKSSKKIQKKNSNVRGGRH